MLIVTTDPYSQPYIVGTYNFVIVIFDIDCDASHIGIGGVLSQGYSIAFFSEKLYNTRKNYQTCDIKILCYCSIITALKTLFNSKRIHPKF